MRRIGTVGFATVLVAAVTVGIGPPGTEECSIVSSHFPRPPESIALLAEATPDTVAFPVEPRPGWPDWNETLFAELDAVYGQYFVVKETLPRSGDFTAGDSVAIVPWAYDPSCTLVPWDESAAWIEPGEVGFFLIDESAYVSRGAVRVDVLGWHEPYPQASWDNSGLPDRRTWMDAATLFALSVDLERNRPGGAADLGVALLQWARENPDDADLYPVSEVISRLRSGN